MEHEYQLFPQYKVLKMEFGKLGKSMSGPHPGHEETVDMVKINLLRDAITHMFMTKQIPGRKNENLEEIEEFLLQTFYTSVGEALKETPFPQLGSTLDMLRKWTQIQPMTKTTQTFVKKFQDEVSNIKNGCTLPMYLRNQNCTILFTKEREGKEGTLKVSTFRSSLPAPMVMTVVGSHTLMFPETMEIVRKINTIKSKVFAELLHELAVGGVHPLGPAPKGEDTFVETRDVADTRLVSEWAIGILDPDLASRDILSRPGSQIEKKIRDQVTLWVSAGSASKLPFRRSGMYTSLKVTLQLKILEEFPNLGVARFLFKILMLRILGDICEQFLVVSEKEIRDTFDIDLGSQMMAKLGLRVKKLEEYEKGKKSLISALVLKNIEELKYNSLEHVESVVEKFSRAMTRAWNQVAFPLLKQGKPQKTKNIRKDYSEDIKHDIVELNEYLEQLMGLNSLLNQNQTIKQVPFPRYKKLEDIQTKNFVDVPNDEFLVKIWLHDVENFIKYGSNHGNVASIFRMLMVYTKTAKGVYKDNPLGISQILLVTLRALELVHRETTLKHPLLLEYAVEVNSSELDFLLLPYHKDMQLLDGMLNYFSTHDKNATQSNILKQKINENSFSARFAAKNATMIKLKNEILRDIEEKIEKKIAEVQATRESCKYIQRKILKEGECECEFEEELKISRRGNLYNCKTTVTTCHKCKLGEVLNDLRKSVWIYQKVMPVKEHCQDAVVFELAIPEDIAVWRDLLAYFKYDVLEEPAFEDENQSLAIEWGKYHKRFLTGTSRKRNVCLGSLALPATHTYHTKTQKRDVLNHEDKDFIVETCMSCHFNYEHQEKLRCGIKTACTFQLNTTANSGVYSNLQKTVTSTDHTQNEVIASQYLCNENLSCQEFIAFGSLRAGHRIQWRNLYEAIVSGIISLEKEPVVALILQTIWQIGPRNAEKKRESHRDICDDVDFAEEFVEMLEKLVERNKGNYCNSLILLNAIIITRRISELNNSLADKCYDAVRKWRNELAKWIDTINLQLSSYDVEKAVLNKILWEINLCSLFSFSVSDSSSQENVVKTKGDILHWFKTIMDGYNINMEEIESSPFLKILLNFAKVFPMRLDIGEISHDLLAPSIIEFCQSQWQKVDECIRKSIKIAGNSIFELKYVEESTTATEHTITFNIINGQFLVDGLSQEKLPENIVQHQLFKRYFKNINNLRVQRDNKGIFTTRDNFHGRKYEFELCNNGLNIKEVQCDDSSKLILIDPDMIKLSKYMSNYFIVNYTHWLDITKRIIYFRSDSPSYYRTHDYQLQQNTGTDQCWQLLHVKSQEYIFAIQSGGFNNIASSLESLEMAKYINVTIDNDKNVVTAHLRRFNMKFTVRDNGCHESIEYPGFSVCRNQSRYGTLIQLAQGLLLQNKQKRILLVPHGEIYLENYRFSSHQTTKILLEKLRQPPLFVYEFDDVLKRLKAHNSKAAWLYLAALHAATSSSLPDQFTEMTGTETAMGILQSARVWSCSRYDDESLKTLHFIKHLSPLRTYYGFRPTVSEGGDNVKYIEAIKWPNALSSMAAYDGFALIVEKLIADSNRLSAIYANDDESVSTDPKEEPETERLLCLRGYFRNLKFYNSSAAINLANFWTTPQLSLLANTGASKTVKPCSPEILKLDSLGKVMSIFNKLDSKNVLSLTNDGTFKKNNLTEFLMVKNELLEAPLPPIPLDGKNSFLDLFHLDFRPNWLKLYRMATCIKSREDYNLFTFILSSFAYKGAPVEQIVNLLCISNHVSFGVVFPQLESDTSAVSDPTCHNFDSQVVEGILEHGCEPFPRRQPWKPTSSSIEAVSKYQKDMENYNKEKEKYAQKLETLCSETMVMLESQWPCQAVNKMVIIKYLQRYQMDTGKTIEKINKCLQTWFQAFKIKTLIDDVQKKLNEIYDTFKETQKGIIIITSDHNLTRNATNTEIKGYPDIEVCSKLTINDFVNINIRQEQLLNVEFINRLDWLDYVNENGVGDLSKQRKRHVARIQELKFEIFQMLNVNSASRIIMSTGIVPRLSPTSLLSILQTSQENRIIHETVREYVCALGVLWAQLKRLNRCLAVFENKADLERELSNPGHEDWTPLEFPEWLLLELELDIMIRPIQVKVAMQMITMPGEKNGVTQLNMGQGKTSVIVPMLCSTPAKNKNNAQLCRVTVLSSMFKMNLNSLTFSIGGLLNRRVYTIPSKRDMKIDISCVDNILNVYKECLNMHGVVLTLPEYRLSFRLLSYDKILNENRNLGFKLLTVEEWLRNHARDVLDESDELFNVKYQLVYTVGEPVSVDGGDLRWKLCQDILRIAQDVGKRLWDNYGASKVEFDDENYKTNGHRFAKFRLLDKFCLEEFNALVADMFLKSFRNITKAEKVIVKRFICQNQIEEFERNRVIKEILKNKEEDLNKLLLVSGYLQRGVLGLALTKRWRVEYGVNPKSGFRRMAVPFRAKDVAAEKTEFGHPDLAIILTHLSYYYSGLDDDQMDNVFETLKAKNEPEDRYRSWVDEIKNADKSSLNMKDKEQKAKVYELLRKHKAVVDYWLSNSVFPLESKQFPGKLVMTCWDLCFERQVHPVTGFSGTNDSKILLPLMISQQDLPELQNTNKTMEETLLQPENRNHKGFRMGVTCEEILESMKKDNLSVLIDAGALMWEKSNEQIADLWLDVNRDIEAVVYFSKENDLLVKSRGDTGRGTPFDVSPFQERLEKCGVFLDDQHTRGTDLKFPVKSKACVTVGTRMKRDKLIQACMRMRKLGQGHSVTFYLSHEANSKVMMVDGSSTDITTRTVLDWVCQNTKEFNEDGLLYWAIAGRNYAQRWAAEENFYVLMEEIINGSSIESESISASDFEAREEIFDILANQCVDDEVLKLMEMYGEHTSVEKLSQLIPKWFRFTLQKWQKKNNNEPMSRPIIHRFRTICRAIQKRCETYAADKEVVTSLTSMVEEEQEKELEQELQVEVKQQRIIERPKMFEKFEPSLHGNVKSLVLNGGPVEVKEGIILLPSIFSHSTFWIEVEPNKWGNNLFATTDFARVIKRTVGNRRSFQTNSFLRPINYFVSCKLPVSSGQTQVLLLSPFEVNELMPYFRNGESKCKLHMFSMRRREKQDLLVDNRRLQLPVNLRSTGDNISNDSGGVTVAALLLASGNLYFNSKIEIDYFVKFIGLMDSEEMEEGTVSMHGFQTSKASLVKKILACRHPFVSDVTHVIRVLSGQHIHLE